MMATAPPKRAIHDHVVGCQQEDQVVVRRPPSTDTYRIAIGQALAARSCRAWLYRCNGRDWDDRRVIAELVRIRHGNYIARRAVR